MVVHAYYPLGEIRVQREARALIDAGFEVDVICLRRSGEPPRAAEHNVQIYRLPVIRHKRHGILVQLLEYLAFFLLATWQLLTLHLQRPYTTIQVHNLPDFLVFSALIPRQLGARVILDLHDLMPEFYAARFGGDLNSWPVRLVRLQEQMACRFAHHVITVTETWRQTLIERGVPADKCSVVMNLPDPRVFQVEQGGPSRPRPSNGLVKLFYHGNVTHRYGLDILVSAFEQAHRQLPHIRLTVHGRGDYQRELELLIEKRGLSQTVALDTELLPLEQVVSLAKSADLAIVPYRHDIFTDGILPTKLMEYAALGVPTIATDSTAIRAYFDREMVHFVPADDVAALAEAIIKLVTDPEQMKRLSENIRRFNQLYNWRDGAQAYIRLLESLGDRR